MYSQRDWMKWRIRDVNNRILKRLRNECFCCLAFLLDIFPATDCKPNFSNCNISLWLIITSLATIKARLFFETFHFFASRDVHASFTAKTTSLLLLMIRLLEHYSGFAIGTFGCQRLLPSSIQCSQWIKSFHRGIKSSNLILSQKKNFWYFYSWLLQLGTD